MQQLLEHPAVQGGVLPLIVALIFGAVFARTRYAWLALAVAFATMIALTVGFSFSPLTASRKVTLVLLAAALVGVVVDSWPSTARGFAPALAIAAGIVAPWVFLSILAQREATAGYVAAAGIAAFALVMTYAVMRLRSDGQRVGAAGLGLGLGVGIAAVLSASIGFLLSGVALAAACGAMLLVQLAFSRNIVPGFTATLPLGLGVALFAIGSVLLAELKWYLVPLFLLIPAAVALPAPGNLPRIVRAAILAGYACVAAAIPILAAWYAARGSLS